MDSSLSIGVCIAPMKFKKQLLILLLQTGYTARVTIALKLLQWASTTHLVHFFPVALFSSLG